MSKGRYLLVALALVHLTCGSVLLTAPPGTTFAYLRANPSFISANGGVSVVTALLIEPAGTAVADGTVIQFFTDLGRIDQQGKTSAGVARVNLVADSRSGTAHVEAFSGGNATSGTTAGSAITKAVDVTIGNPNAASVVLTANPPRIGSSRFTYVTANVFDSRGNPVQSVPVFFIVDSDPAFESFSSGGAPIFTDNDGRSTDVLSTRRPVPGDATVRVQVPNGATTILTATLVIPIG